NLHHSTSAFLSSLFYSHRHHRALHSFPTRRSSDLLEALIDWSYDLLDSEEQEMLERLSVFAGGFDLQSAEAVAGSGFDSPTCVRSEEHTSELQSPCNLVCRLLLEKKNKNKNTNIVP